jgi:hypothetical protein
MVQAYVDEILETIKNRRTDTVFNNVLTILCRQNFSKDTIDISLLKPNYNFKIYNAVNAPVDRVKKIGSLSFSKIAFNLTRDTACVFTSFICGEFCSKGDIYFFIKEHGKWRYIKKWELWNSESPAAGNIGLHQVGLKEKQSAFCSLLSSSSELKNLC